MLSNQISQIVTESVLTNRMDIPTTEDLEHPAVAGRNQNENENPALAQPPTSRGR